jgi:ABC-type multidrug transport system ATPase subunit
MQVVKTGLFWQICKSNFIIMKVNKLFIKSRFKNLENFLINFDENNLMTVIVGPNGSGKSNVLEALVSIFRNIDLGEAPQFSFEIIYRLGEKDSTRWDEVIICADHLQDTLSKQYEISVRDLKNSLSRAVMVPISNVKRNKHGYAIYLPKYLFAYYSGPSNRLENYFQKHRTDFYRKLLKNKIDLKGDIRPLFYAKQHHSQFVLLAFFMSKQNSTEKEFLREHLGIEGLDSVHFVMRKADWTKKQNLGELFWGADGVVRKFLDILYPQVIAPVKIKRNESVSQTGKNYQNEFLHLFLPNVDSLIKFANNLSPDELFKMLESTLLSEIISEVNIRVKVKSSDIPLTFKELSEGEQQLLTVLGLLKFTGGDDSLFILDEPDTHLNPSWAVQYLKFLRKFVPNHKTSHLFMVTHHPLAISELEKEQVQVIWRDENNQAYSKQPDESPRGMGINLILRSDMFGLKTTLDDTTQKKLSIRNSLAAKDELSKEKIVREEGLLPENEEIYLKRLNEDLAKLGFNLASDDPDYLDFLQQKYYS